MTVKVYSTPTCIWCTRAKEYFQQNNIEYVEYDVSVDRDKAMEMVDKSGQRGVPVIDIEGNIIVGFDQEKINELLGL